MSDHEVSLVESWTTEVGDQRRERVVATWPRRDTALMNVDLPTLG